MELSDLKPSERVIEIVKPGKFPVNIGVRVSLVSFEDDRLKKSKRRQLDRKLALDARGKHFKAEELEESRDNFLFEAMTGWEWYKVDKNGKEDAINGEQATFHGAVPGFDRRSVVAVFEELSWFRNQIDEAIAEENDFFDQSAPN